MKTPKSNRKDSTYHKWRKKIISAFLIIVLFPTILFTIGWFNRDTLINYLQDWYNENNSGTLTIGKINTSFMSEFPKVGFTLKNIKQTNTDTIAKKFSTSQIEEAKVTISAANLLSGNIKFDKIKIKNAVITSEVKSNKSLAYHKQLKHNKNNSEDKGFTMPEWTSSKEVSFLVENVKYISKDTILNKNFNLYIHKIEGSYKGNKRMLNGNLTMSITVNKLGFNTEKGSYFNGAHITGNPDFTIDLEHNNISVPEFLFNVDAQTFNLSANFDLHKSDNYQFKLQNSNTDFKALKSLLPNNISSKIQIYNLKDPIKTKLNLSGKFAYGNSPNIEVDFSTVGNNIQIGKKLNLKNVSLQGHLTNDLYKTDSLRNVRKSDKDLKIIFNNLSADLDQIKVDISNAYFRSTPEALNYVNADIRLEGSNEALANLIETDNFDFKGGTFLLNASVSGDLPNAYQFVNKATGNFKLNNTRVILKKNGLQLPIQTISLSLERENSTLNKLLVNFPNGEDLVLRGKLKNISALLSKNPKTSTTSNILLDSKKLNINDIIELAKKFVPENKKNIDDRKNLHETLETVYNQFHPSFDINVEALTYNEVTISNLKSKIDLVNSKTILFRNFDFNYSNTLTKLKGNLVIPEPESNFRNAIYIDAEAKSNGSITVFEKLFDIQLFAINSGEYQFNGNVNGNLQKFNEILKNTKGDLTLNNTKLYYDSAKMEINIDSLALYVNNSDLFLNKFNLEIGELNPINLSGNIKKFPSFLIDKTPNNGSVFLKITSSFIDGNSTLNAINSLKDEDKLKITKNKNALHQIFKDINKFNPEIELAIDSLKYQNLITENVKARVFFINDSILKLNHLNFNYKQTVANINGEINAHTSQLDSINNNPFDLDFRVNVKGKSKDLNDYLKTKNFIFQTGDFEFIGQYKAQAKNLRILESKGFGDLKISKSLVDYNAAGLQIPMDSLHIEINNDVATLKTLDINLPGKSSVYFSGSINRFSDFINNTSNDEPRSSNFSIYSPFIDSSDIVKFLANSTSNKVESDKKEFDLKQFKEAMVGINTSFYPIANISIDTLSHNDLHLTNFGINLWFDDNANFKIEDTHLNFYGGSIDMSADVGLTEEYNTPVKIKMTVTDINIHELITRLDYFDDEALRNTDRIEGNLNFNIETTGTVNNDGKLNLSSLNGKLELNLSNLELFNYKPIMENSILMKDERFKNLSFRPIKQTFEIINGELIIPRTEIQSTALHLFAEGSLKFNDYVNIWLSLPWKNLKSNDGLTLPKKTTYANAGSKFYLQLLKDKTEKKEKNQKLKVKFRLSNRKLRKMKNERK